MRVSEEFVNFVFAKAFKGFRVTAHDGLIDADLRLNADELKQLLALRDYFGIAKEQEMRQLINSVIMHQTEGMSLQGSSILSLISLPKASLVLLKRRYDSLLRLIYKGNCCFLVADDNTGSFVAGDIIQSMSIGLEVGSPLYCHLIRNGRRINDDGRLVCVDDIEQILFRIPSAEVSANVSVNQQRCVKPLRTVYAWRPLAVGNIGLIPFEEITTDCRALLLLDLDNFLLSINKKFDPGYYSDNKWNIYEDVLDIVANYKVTDLANSSVEKGFISTSSKGFVVNKKMSIK